MRTVLATIVVATLAGRAPADAIVPARCHVLLAAPAPTLALALAHRISAATCMAGIRLDAAQRSLEHTTEVIQTLGDAVAPSIMMLDEVIQAGDPAMAIIAERAKGDLYISLGIRLRDLVPPIGAIDPKLHAELHAAIEPAVRPWLEAGDRSFAHAQELAEATPDLTEDPVVLGALRISSERRADTRAIVGSR